MKTPRMNLTRFGQFAPVVLLGVGLLIGCSTVAPKPVTPAQPSFLGSTNADSGILALIPGTHAAIVTDAVRVRYDLLIIATASSSCRRSPSMPVSPETALSGILTPSTSRITCSCAAGNGLGSSLSPSPIRILSDAPELGCPIPSCIPSERLAP